MASSKFASSSPSEALHISNGNGIISNIDLGELGGNYARMRGQPVVGRVRHHPGHRGRHVTQ
jgi:hypothetical protein